YRDDEYGDDEYGDEAYPGSHALNVFWDETADAADRWSPRGDGDEYHDDEDEEDDEYEEDEFEAETDEEREEYVPVNRRRR
ncbi:MAG: hypothetical protein ACODAD_04720, partial [Planctomycetota bacterium]